MFVNAEDTENMVCRRVQQDIEIGVYPVLFGLRLRAGYIGYPACYVDWCCGDDVRLLAWAYGALEFLLSCSGREKDPFNGIPACSNVKPIMNDTGFLLKVCGLVEKHGGHPGSATLPPYLEIRERYRKSSVCFEELRDGKR